MFDKLKTFFRFADVIPVKPARPPSARLKPPVRPEVKPVRPEVKPARPAIEPARPQTPAPARPPFVMPTSFPVAVATIIRGFGRHTEKPTPEKIKAAENALGPDRAAYLKALDMVDGQLTKYVLSEHRLDDPDAELGLRRRLDHDTYNDLPTWREAERQDAKNRRHLEWAGRPVPPPLHVPETVQIALIKALNAAAAKVARGGRDGNAGSSGGPAPAPPETPAVADMPVPDDAGGRSKVAGKKKKPDEPEDGSGAPAAPEPVDETAESDGDREPPKP